MWTCVPRPGHLPWRERTAGRRAISTAAARWPRADDARAETTRAREDAAREIEQLRADAARERDEIIVRLTGTAQRLSQMTTARAGELTQSRADAARRREELRAALESRAQVLEELRGELRSRGGRAERDLGAARA